MKKTKSSKKLQTFSLFALHIRQSLYECFAILCYDVMLKIYINVFDVFPKSFIFRNKSFIVFLHLIIFSVYLFLSSHPQFSYTLFLIFIYLFIIFLLICSEEFSICVYMQHKLMSFQIWICWKIIRAFMLENCLKIMKNYLEIF